VSSWWIPLTGEVVPGRDEVGGKAHGVAWMRSLGLPVPPAFVLPAWTCARYGTAGELPDEAWRAVRAGIAHLEAETGRRFGVDLLVSVRSGAAVSMPGMMDTVLDLGITAAFGDDPFARDTRERFLRGYRQIVLRDPAGPVPDDPWEQLRAAVMAVYDSWYSRRARVYRKHYGISDDSGTAVTVQAMVFGNRGADSGTGVLFSRDPLRGTPEPYGEYLPGGQGEDVVAGTVDPKPLSYLASTLPAVHDALLSAAALLERRAGDMQDIEFTVQEGELYLLQTRAGKRAPAAAVRIAVDLAAEDVISEEEAVRRVSADQARTVLRPSLAESVVAEVLAKGQPACPGAAAGVVVTDADEVVRRAAAGEDVVFAAATTRPEDVHAMIDAVAVCTETGGATSHAAVVCRGLGRTSVVGCGAGTLLGLAGTVVTVDADRGRVLAGRLPMTRVSTSDDPHLARLASWAAERSPVRVVTDAPPDVLDLDAAEVVDLAELPAALAGVTAVRGSIVETDEGVAAAVRAGVGTIVTAEPLPVLLAALAAIT
jgi:pyruvate, orthophosphate dikinase